MGISCPWSPTGTADVWAPWFSCRYSFRKPFLTNSSNWCPNAKQLRKLWPKAWLNLHQVSLLGPSLLLVFGGDFNLSATLGITISSLRSIRKLCLVGAPSFVCALLCRGLVYPHGLRTTNSPRSSRANTPALFCYLFLFADVGNGSVTDLSKCLWTTPYQRITERSWQHSSPEGVYHHVFVLNVQLHPSARNLCRKSFQGSPWYCFTSKRLKDTGRGT